MSSSLLGRPLTDATLTIRVIKNFPYRTCKNLVLHNLDLSTLTVRELKEIVKSEVQGKPGWKAYKNVALDTLKLYTKAHGTKTMNLIINMEDVDDLLIFRDDGKALAEYDCGKLTPSPTYLSKRAWKVMGVARVEHETELSFFNMSDYLEFKANPEEKW